MINPNKLINKHFHECHVISEIISKLSELSAELCVHPVGHGLFYSGKITINNSVFNFVYDCGTSQKKQYINNIINNNYKTFNPTDSIDLLIISHFHKDHINGIVELVNKYKIKEVVLPYLFPAERLLVIAKPPDEPNNPDNPDSTDNQDEPDEPDIDTVSLCLSPDSFFLERNKDTIITYITSSNNGDELLNSQPYWHPNRSIDKNEFEDLKDTDNVTIRNHQCKFIPNHFLWLFKFFCNSVNINNTYIDKKSFMNYFEKAIPKENREDIMDFINEYIIKHNENKSVDLKLFLKNNLNSLKVAYKSLLKYKINFSSIICSHGPAGEKPSFNQVDTLLLFDECKCLSIDKPIHMLTGDASIKEKGFYNSFINHFSEELSFIGTFLIPHHGADNYWNNSIINDISHCRHFIISYDINKCLPKILIDIQNTQAKMIHHSNQENIIYIKQVINLFEYFANKEIIPDVSSSFHRTSS